MVCNKSAGNVASKGRGSTSSCGSRPLLPFLVNHSDSAIGSSLDGSFSCSFLPPPPPYRPPCSTASGSDDVFGAAEQQQKAPQGKDFTSLLGFDTLVLPSSTSTRSGSEEQKNKQHTPAPTKIMQKDSVQLEPSIITPKNNQCSVNNNHCLSTNDCLATNCSSIKKFPPEKNQQILPSTNQKSQSSSHIFQCNNNIQLEQVKKIFFNYPFIAISIFHFHQHMIYVKLPFLLKNAKNYKVISSGR
ncbi:unnamed protein product [Meloidogyne enterolobii]|uniref:Uncharacterized protein n=1 Tax=Meloidogyne enterolobii TaxID=390850 RepID=A0ACB1AJ61_MELEN